ncbi:MAG: hypothetical protein U1E42_08400 [Rhodospirillales bacterium]
MNLNPWLWAASPGRLVGQTARDVLEAARQAFDVDADHQEFDDALTRLGYRPLPTADGAYELRLPDARR